MSGCPEGGGDYSLQILQTKCSWGPKTQKQWGGAKNFEVIFHYTIFVFDKCSWGPETQTNIEGTEILGCLGRQVVARGRKTIHFFL